MPVAAATNHKISWFKREDEAGSLDLTPEFQRRPLWTPEQSSYLIDTVVLGLPFPEIYLRSITTPEGATSYQVVDGQQRIRALLGFARNDLELVGDDVSPRLVGRSFDDLSPAEKTAFWDYEVVVRDLSGASDTEIRDLFRRLNIASVNLNDQELRHAKYRGDFITVVESLADDEWWTDMRVVTVRQVRRMEDVEYVGELLVALMAGPQDKKRTLDQYYIDYENGFPEKDRWCHAFRDTRSLVEMILGPDGTRRWSGKSDFYSLFSVLGTFVLEKSKWSPTQKQRARDGLMRFRNQVALAKRRDNKRVFPARVHTYADAVTRAASDIARRTIRGQILREILENARKT